MDFQETITDEARIALARSGSALVTSATGSGKTVMIAEMARRTLERGMRVQVMVNRQELVSQTAEKLLIQTGMEPGIVWRDRKEWDRPATILAQNSVMAHGIPPEFTRPDLLVVDEAHHTVAPSWLRTIAELNPRYLLGMSATPFRTDKEPLSPDPFKEVIRTVTPMELIERDILCPAVIESPVILGPEGRPQKIGLAGNLPQIYLEAVRYAVAQGRTKIILYVSRTPESTATEIMERTRVLLTAGGITTNVIGQGHGRRDRKRTFDSFKEAPGASCIINYQTLTEGTDLPMVDAVIIGRYTDSESTIIQMIGRGMRKHESKRDCLVLDYTGRKDMEGIIHYWRIDEPREPGASNAAQPGKLSKPELEQLTVEFRKAVSPMGVLNLEYSWFRPYPNRALLAMPLHGDGKDGSSYLTVEPMKNGAWRTSRVTLASTGPTPVIKQQTGGLLAEDALLYVRKQLGSQAPFYERSAPWRQKLPSDSQVRAWKALRKPAENAPQTAGDISDAIAKERFVRRVAQEIL